MKPPYTIGAAVAACGLIVFITTLFLFLACDPVTGLDETPESKEQYSWGENIRVSFTEDGATNPDCATDLENNTHIVYQRDMGTEGAGQGGNGDEGNIEIYYTVLDWRDNKLVNDIRISNVSGHSVQPRIALDSTGSAHIIWQDDRTGFREIYYARLDADRNIIINDTRISGNGSSAADGGPVNNGTSYANATAPSLCTDGNGAIYIVWVRHTGDSNGSREIVYEKIVPGDDDNNGDAASDDTIRSFDDRLLSDPALISHAPRIDCSGGEVHVAWYGLVEGNYDIFYAELQNDTTLVEATRLTTATNIFNCDIAVDAQNRSHVVWSDDRWGNFEIYYSLMENGITLIDDTRITNASGSSVDPSIALDPAEPYTESPPESDPESPSQMVYLSWQDDRKKSNTPLTYFSKLDPLLHPHDGSAAKFHEIVRVANTVVQTSNEKAIHPVIAVNLNGYVVIVREDYQTGSAEIVYRHTEKPDLVAGMVTILTDEPEDGNPLELSVSVLNEGQGKAQATQLRIDWSDGLFGYETLSSLAPGGSTDVLISRSGVHGDLSYTIRLDANGTLDELNEGNNEVNGSVFVRSYGLSLALVNVSIPVSITPGDQVQFNISVTNTGNHAVPVNLSFADPGEYTEPEPGAYDSYTFSQNAIIFSNESFILISNQTEVFSVTLSVPLDTLAGDNGFLIAAQVRSSVGDDTFVLKSEALQPVPVSVEQIHHVDLSCEFPEQSTEDSAEFMITAANRGNGEENIMLFLDGASGNFSLLDRYFVTVPAFSETDVSLIVSVPSTMPAGPVIVTVGARSSVDPGAEDQVNITVISLQRFGCSVELLPAAGEIALDGLFEVSLLVENTGNKIDTFIIEYQTDSDFAVVIDPAAEGIPAGGSAALNYTVTAPTKKLAADYPVIFTVYAGDGKTLSTGVFNITVLPSYGVDVSLKEELPQVDASKSFLYYVNNTGNARDTYNLGIYGPLENWGSVDEYQITVNAYSFFIVNVTVTALDNLSLRGTRLQLLAESQTSHLVMSMSDTSIITSDDRESSGSSSDKPFYFTWWFILLVVVIIGIVVFYFVFWKE